jgi:hypothetical protein
VIVTAPPEKRSRLAARPSRKAGQSKVNYFEDESGEDSESDAVVELHDDSDDSLEKEKVQPKKRSRPTSSTRKKTASKPQKSAVKASSRTMRTTTYDDDSDDDDKRANVYGKSLLFPSFMRFNVLSFSKTTFYFLTKGLDEDWGTASTKTAR